MPDQFRYDYAVIRVVPKVEREEFINVGVILSCPQIPTQVKTGIRIYSTDQPRNFRSPTVMSSPPIDTRVEALLLKLMLRTAQEEAQLVEAETVYKRRVIWKLSWIEWSRSQHLRRAGL